MMTVARWVSILAHPFVMVALLIAVPAMRRSSRTAFEAVLVVTVAAIVPIGILMFRQVRRGEWSNVDASKPSERPLLFVVALAGVVAALAWFVVNDPQSFLVRGMAIVAVFIVLAALLTRWVKLSLHVAFVTLTATALSLTGSWIGFMLIGLTPVMCWSRMALDRHRAHELAAGVLLGAITGIALARF